MKLASFTIVAVLLALFAAPVEPCCAGDLFYASRAKSRTDCKLPNYNYSDNSWPFTTPRKFGATVIAVAATNAKVREDVKPFHFRATALIVDHIVLDDVGLSLYENGKLFASGRITNTGGDGGLIGNNVTIQIRAYVSHTGAASPRISPAPVVPSVAPGAAGVLPAPVILPIEGDTIEREIPIATPNEVTRIPPDAYRVWSSEIKLWVSRGRPHHVSLVDPVDHHQDMVVLRRHFDEITHLEVELEYERDR